MKTQTIDLKAHSFMRQQLNRSFVAKCEANPRYSLRAYARDLKLDATLLSRLMKGERAFSTKMMQRLIGELNLPLQDVMDILSEENLHIKGQKLEDQIFTPISKWYFFAILDLFLLPDFKSNPKWVAQKLGLSLTEAHAALQILNDQRHININQKPWVVNSQNTQWTNLKASTRERQNYQKQLLEKSKEAIDTISFDQRENSSLTLATNSKLIPEIKKKIQKFKNEIRELIESEENYDSVYQVVISCFPLTNKELQK